MENPRHDAITPQQIRDVAQHRQAEFVLNQARKTLREVYDRAFHSAQYHASSNLSELAYALPEMSLAAPKDIPLKTTVIETKRQPMRLQAPAETPSGNPTPTLLNQRIISTGGNEVMIAFDVEYAGEVTLKLHPTGAERISETRIDIIDVEDLDYPGKPAVQSSGSATINVEENRRVRLKVTAAQDIANRAFTLQ